MECHSMIMIMMTMELQINIRMTKMVGIIMIGKTVSEVQHIVLVGNQSLALF